MAREFLLYTRGFVGSKEHATESTRPIRRRAILSVFDLQPEAIQHAAVNEQIVLAFNQLVRRQVAMTDFDWRERVVRAGLKAFGTRSVREWLSACERSPTFTQTHADCISDWLRFCQTGKRNLPVMTWERLVQSGANDPASPAKVDTALVAKLPFGYSHIHNCVIQENNLHTIVTLSLSRPGGFTDLVTTLYTFFGEPTNLS